MNLTNARKLLALYVRTAAQRPLTKQERQAAVNLRARIRSLTGNHFAA